MRPAPEIKGWCPSALRPMQSGDGLLMRPRIIGSLLRAEQAFEIADIARSCGNGLLDLSQRAQVQIRGLREGTLHIAQQRLSALGLLGGDEGGTANVLVSPLAANRGFDANSFALRLADAVSHDSALRGLPAKFLFLVDDDSRPGLKAASADIFIECIDAATPRLAVSLDGARARSVILAPQEALNAALALARVFVALSSGESRRMHGLVSAVGAAAILQRAGLETAAYAPDRRETNMRDILGAHHVEDRYFVGVAAPLGRWDTATFATLAKIAAQGGSGELRLTPWRALLLPARLFDDAQRVCASAASLGLIVDARDPRLSIVACPGAPECSQARGVTRANLDRLAPLAQALAGDDGVGLHLSGCAKGCARQTGAPLTAIANGEGFDLVDDGCASDAGTARVESFDALEAAILARAKLRQKEPSCPAH